MDMLIRSAQLGLWGQVMASELRSPWEKIFWLTEEVGLHQPFYLNDSVLDLEPFFFQTQWKMAIKFISQKDFVNLFWRGFSLFIWLTWSILYLWRRSLDTESCTWPLVSTSANIAFTITNAFLYSILHIKCILDIMVR